MPRALPTAENATTNIDEFDLAGAKRPAFDEHKRRGIRSLTAKPDKGPSDRSDVSANDLAEAIEATFSRAVRLPGTRRFDMDKSNETRLLDPMVLAKKELHLGILACEPAVETILSMIDQLLDGSIAPSFVTMRTIAPSRPEHAETREFLEAVDALKSWNSMAGYDDHIDAGTACHAHRGHRLARTRACLETGAGRLKTMLIDLGNLPSDPALLQRLLRDMAAAVESRDGEIERLQSIIMKLQRAQFVRRSERLDPDQVALAWKTSMPTSPASGRADTEHPSIIGAAIPMQAAARSSAARGRTARHRSSGLCVLWRRTPYDRREHQRDARLGPGTASRGPHYAPEIRLPCLRDGRASGMPPFQEELICAEWRKSTGHPVPQGQYGRRATVPSAGAFQ